MSDRNPVAIELVTFPDINDPKGDAQATDKFSPNTPKRVAAMREFIREGERRGHFRRADSADYAIADLFGRSGDCIDDRGLPTVADYVAVLAFLTTGRWPAAETAKP